MDNRTGIRLSCPACTWERIYSAGDLEGLPLSGELQLDRKSIKDLLAGLGSRIVCPECRSTGVEARPCDSDDDDWQQAVVCEICRKPIPLERLEALPGVRRCVKCQQSSEKPAPASEPEFCPKCGAPLILKVGRGAGITRYKLVCTAGCRT